MPLYNRHLAVEYAIKYAISPNPCYKKYPKDCTNFVSQALRAGGWTEIGGSVFDRKDDGVWWYGNSVWSKASYTWAGAHNFSSFIKKSGRGTSCSRAELTLGDVVQIARKGHVFHTMIVTGGNACSVIDGSEIGPMMSYHTTNTRDKDLNSIEAIYPNDTFLFWKVRDEFKS